MSTIEKSIATTMSMIVLVISLAVVSPTTAIGKGNKRTGNPTSGGNLKKRDVSPSGTGVRSAASRSRVGGKMHLEDISLGFTGPRTMSGNDTVTINDFKRR